MLEDFERVGNSDIIAVTHTCLPFIQDFQNRSTLRHHLLINNGSAGMPNFSNQLFGVISRISNVGSHPNALYGTRVEGTSTIVEALRVPYSHSQFCEYFKQNWDSQSPAYVGYWNRINHGPVFSIPQAQRYSTLNKSS
jgi:hypothetical protein